MNINVPTEFLVTFSKDELNALNKTRVILTNLAEEMNSLECDFLYAEEYRNRTDEFCLTQLDDTISLLNVFSNTNYEDVTFKIKKE